MHRGVQIIGADESAPGVGQVLEDLDKKLDGGEYLCVGLDVFMPAASQFDCAVLAAGRAVAKQFVEQPLSWLFDA